MRAAPLQTASLALPSLEQSLLTRRLRIRSRSQKDGAAKKARSDLDRAYMSPRSIGLLAMISHRSGESKCGESFVRKLKESLPHRADSCWLIASASSSYTD